MDQITSKIFLYLVIVLSAVFHEYAHAYTAYRLGDGTAKDAGRMTLNPLSHIDPLGTVFIPLMLLFTSGIFIGWARPVPYNPYNLRDQKYGDLKVGIAGPGANLIIASILGLIIRALPFAGVGNPMFAGLLGFVIYINIFLALFNLIPLPPLDGSKVFMNLFPGAIRFLEGLGFIGIFLALFIAFYFLSPIARLIFWVITGQSIF